MSELAVIGHQRALEELLAVRSSSLLFVGPEGVGRRRAARWLAASLNCLDHPRGEPCGICDSCRRFADGHPDHREVAAKETTSTGRRNPRPEIKIGQLVHRPGGEVDPLSRWLEQRPAFRRRVGVIDGAERLTVAAANSFLKILEEPPSYATIVLIAPSSQAVLPTIASRCAVLRFGAVDTGGLGSPGHPAHRMGRPGPLLQPDPNHAEVVGEVEAFVASLHGNLEVALAAAESLAQRWQAGEAAPELVDLLRERLRTLPGDTRARADDLLLSSEEAIAAHSPAALTLRVLALELRALVRSG